MSLQEKVAIVTGGKRNITQSNFVRIDEIENNAPRVAPKHQAPTKLSFKDGVGTISANLTRVLLCSKYSVNHLSKNKDTIINIASTRALMCESNREAYSASERVCWH